MDAVAAWCGFFGAWLLVAGPLYQGLHELLEEDDLAAEGGARHLPAPPPPPPSWYWLLPPLMIVLRRRRSREYRRTAFAQMTVAEHKQRRGFLRKAQGWFTVAVGAALIAVKETVELGEVLELHEIATALLIIAAATVALAAVGTSVRGRATGPSDYQSDAPQR